MSGTPEALPEASIPPETLYVAPVPLVPLPARLGILLSGRGSNFEALARACEDGRVSARIAVVISDKEGAGGLEKAAHLGLPTKLVRRAKGEAREVHEQGIAAALERGRVDVICLAGFMRVLSPGFVAAWPRRILNIHPSLLPSFPGLHAQRQALEAGVRVTGATVHFVDTGVDTGPIVGQMAVEVEERDDEETLAARILRSEHQLYPAALERVLRGGWTSRGRRIVFL